MSKAYLIFIYLLVTATLVAGILGGKKIIRNEKFIKWQEAQPVAQDFMKKHDKKFDLVLKLLFVIGIVVLLKGLVIPGIRDIPNVLQKRYEVVEGYALNHAGTSDRKMPKLVTIKPDDGEAIRLRFYSTYPIEEGEYLKVIYLPNLKRGTLLEKSGENGD